MCETYGVSCMCMCISWQCCTLCCNAPTLCCGLSPHVRSSVWQPVNCPLLCKFTNRTCQGHECIHVALCAQPSADHCCAQALSSVVGEAVNAAAGATCSLWPGLLSACRLHSGACWGGLQTGLLDAAFVIYGRCVVCLMMYFSLSNETNQQLCLAHDHTDASWQGGLWR